jgi:hypothetical protein
MAEDWQQAYQQEENSEYSTERTIGRVFLLKVPANIFVCTHSNSIPSLTGWNLPADDSEPAAIYSVLEQHLDFG